MSKEIILIIPPLPFLEDKKRNCPLGILYIASVLEEANYDVRVIDLRDSSPENWTTIPLCNTYGITSSSIDLPYAVEVAKFLRARQKCKIIIGGPATLNPDTCLSHGFIVVKGEGERLVIAAIESGLSVIESKKPIETLDSLPFPARHLLPKDSVVSTALCHNGILATTAITSRGCPYNCHFCASPKLWGRKVRKHSPEWVIEEVKSLVRDYNIKEIKFLDDDLNLDREWLRGLAPLSDLVKFRCSARAQAGNWDILKQIGCYEADIGLETANPDAHKMHKGVSLDSTLKGIWEAYEAGLELRLCLIIGLPYDTGDISGRTIELIEKRLPPAKFPLSVFSPCPGSRIGDHPAEFGLEHLCTAGTTSAQDEKPVFTFRLDHITTEELTYHYNHLRAYLKEEEQLCR